MKSEENADYSRNVSKSHSSNGLLEYGEEQKIEILRSETEGYQNSSDSNEPEVLNFKIDDKNTIESELYSENCSVLDTDLLRKQRDRCIGEIRTFTLVIQETLIEIYQLQELIKSRINSDQL